MVTRGKRVCHTELKEILIYAKKILDVPDVAGIYVMTGMKRFVEDAFHASITVLMEFMKLFRVTRIH